MPEFELAELEPQSGLFRYTRNSFRSAGQNSYDTPPTQDPDAFEYLQNTLPVVTDQLQRRWGQVPILTWPGAQIPFRLDEFRTTTGNTRGLVTADKMTASLYDEGTLASLVNPLFTYQNNLLYPRFVTSRSFLYTGNGTDMLKSNGAVGFAQQNWGIAQTALTSAGIGPNNPTIATPTGTWTSPNNALAKDGSYASYLLSNVNGGARLQLSTYNFSVPLDIQITGIQVTVYGYTDSATPDGAQSLVYLTKNQIPGQAGNIKTFLPSGTPGSSVVLGGPTDLWGTGFNPIDLAGTFSVNIQPFTGAGITGSLFVDAVQVTLFYNTSFTFTASSGGSITLTSGRRYYIVYKNGLNGHLSDLSAPTISTGPLTNEKVTLQGLPISPDPQVTNRVLLATADGGDLTTLYELAILNNTDTTYVDNTLDINLLEANIYLETDIYGIQHGVAGNTPPPPTSVFIKHKGRIYFLNGSQLYFSKSDDEMTTSTGLICGRYEESVPGDYQMDISEEAEIGSALFSDGSVLYIATEKQIRRIYGDGPQDFSIPEIHFTDVGIMSPETIQTVYVDGRPSGVCWLTPDLKVIGSDFLFYQNIGKPVQDILNSINPAAVRTAAYSQFFAQGSFQFFVLAVPTGTSTANNTVLVYDLTRKTWHTWVFPSTVTITSMLANITVNGTPRLLIGGYYSATVGASPVSYLWQLTPGVTQDTVIFGGPAVSITAIARSTWQTFSDVNLRKDFNEIEVFTKDPALTLTMEGASNSREFASPTSIFTNFPLSISAFGEYKWYLAAQRTVDRFYRFTYTSSVNDVNFIDGYRMDIIPEHRF